MIYIKLTDKTVAELEQIFKNDIRHKSRARAQALMLSNQRKTTREITEIVKCSQRTLYRWFGQFNPDNISSLHELSGRGRKPKFTLGEHEKSVKKHIKKNIISMKFSLP